MITEKQFEDAFTACGGWFFLTQYETIANWTGSKEALIEHIFEQGFDNKMSGSRTRVSSALCCLGRLKLSNALYEIDIILSKAGRPLGNTSSSNSSV